MDPGPGCSCRLVPGLLPELRSVLLLRVRPYGMHLLARAFALLLQQRKVMLKLRQHPARCIGKHRTTSDKLQFFRQRKRSTCKFTHQLP